MSLGNDPSNTPPRDEPEPDECPRCGRGCHGSICPDCHHERQAGRTPSQRERARIHAELQEFIEEEEGGDE